MSRSVNSGSQPVDGIRLSAGAAHIRYTDRDDLVLVEINEGATVSAVFTQNAFCAAPVQLSRQHLSQATPRYLLINSGNANAGTGQPGLQLAKQSCELVADLTRSQTNQVLPFSTGVIGEPLLLEPFERILPTLVKQLSATGWQTASQAIMTTDTVAKLLSRSFEVDGKIITITGMAKGSGMIKPNMATLLAFIATDAEIPQDLLNQYLSSVVEISFNAITVDGDTSTNDACVLMASGKAGVSIDSSESLPGQRFYEVLTEVCQELARMLIRDAEGASKLVEIQVKGAKDPEEGRRVAYAVAESPLVKTALFASDPNWGRILAAVGRAGLVNLDIDRVSIWLGDICVAEAGAVSPGYREEDGQSIFSRDEFEIKIDLDRGNVDTKLLTCDFSYDYVKINAEYRS